MYKALVFDFDFTLGDSAAGIAASINYALGRLGYPEKEMEAIKKTIGLSLKNTFTALTQNEDDGKRTCLPDISGKKQMRS
ncbi:MAG: HAD family hydrolase [[Clostridium] symbiosum]